MGDLPNSTAALFEMLEAIALMLMQQATLPKQSFLEQRRYVTKIEAGREFENGAHSPKAIGSPPMPCCMAMVEGMVWPVRPRERE